jgi:outer membrane receptor for ferrienterochelin and colicins
MDQMVVTATRSEKLLQDVPVVTEVVSRQEFQERGAENLAQALEDRPGIVVEPNSSGGKVLRMNGLDGKHVLILKDGVPVAGKLNSRVEMNLFDVDDVDRIEIVKGPGSALYGSEAMGGVINIISRGFSQSWQGRSSLRGGSYDLASGHADVSGSVAGLDLVAGLDQQQGGIDKNEININISEQTSKGAFGRLRRQSKGLGTWSAGIDYKNDVQNSDDKDRLNRAVDHETDVRRSDYNLNWDKTLTRRVAVKATGYISDYFRSYSSQTRVAGAVATIDTSKEKISGFRSDVFHQWGKNVLMDFGYDFSHDNFFSVRVKNREVSRDQHGLFGQMEAKPWQPLTLVVGGRYDRITDLDGHFSPRISAMWSAASALKFRAAWGGGFRAPNFVDMYIDYRNPYITVIGNPDLKPERSQGYMFGIEQLLSNRVLLNATVSQNRFRDMILDYTVKPGTQSYQNVAKATFTGFEWQSRFFLTNYLTATLGYNYTHISDLEQKEAVNTIYPHSASLRVTCSLLKNRVQVSLRDQFYSSRDIVTFDPVQGMYQTTGKSAYDMLDATIRYRLFSAIDVRAGVTNVRDYTDKEYGPWIGRRYFAGLDLSYK